MLGGRPMHAINFALKRAHLCTVAVGQQVMDLVVPEMTPARFDLLYYIRRGSLLSGTGKIAAGTRKQRDIVRTLGLDKSTVAKMIRRLEEMGWLTRQRDCEDRRVKLVALTKKGLRAIGDAMRFVFRRRALAKPYDRIARLFHPDAPVTKGLAKIWDVVDGIARFMGDFSGLWYEGGPPYFRNRRQFLASRTAQRYAEYELAPIDEYLEDLGHFISWVGHEKKRRAHIPGPPLTVQEGIDRVYIELGYDPRTGERLK